MFSVIAELTQRNFCAEAEQLPVIVETTKKPVIVYFWSGTCDLSVKRGKYINYNPNHNIVNDIITYYQEACEFVSQFEGCKIKFIGQPIYLISLYNDVQGHMRPTDILEADEIIEQRVDLLNQEIESLNQSIGVYTIEFNADLRDAMHHITYYYFELLEGGLNPDTLLSQKWLRRLQIDVVKECFTIATEDILDIHVNPSELFEFE